MCICIHVCTYTFIMVAISPPAFRFMLCCEAAVELFVTRPAVDLSCWRAAGGAIGPLRPSCWQAGAGPCPCFFCSADAARQTHPRVAWQTERREGGAPRGRRQTQQPMSPRRRFRNKGPSPHGAVTKYKKHKPDAGAFSPPGAVLRQPGSPERTVMRPRSKKAQAAGYAATSNSMRL